MVLPDGPAAGHIAETFPPTSTKQVSHPSGRPWLLGWWPDGALVLGQAGKTRAALIGQHAVDDEQLSAACSRIDRVADLDPFARSLAGSAHLVASVDGRVRVQGTLTGLRRVFHARVDGVAVAADRADVVARLLAAEVDVHRLASHLLDAAALYPVAGDPVWRGVTVLDTMRYLVLEPDGQQRSVHWWTAPEPVVPMAEAAPALGEALSVAVGVRVRGRQLVSADLGGLDSTSVCCLAATRSPSVVAYTADGRDPMAEDALWARRTVAHFDNVEHHVIPGDQLPSLYDGLRDTDDGLDEPSGLSVLRNRSLFIPRQAAARGSQLHLTGFGGDELLAGSPAHLHAMLRRDPRLALRHARGFATQRAWRYRDALRQLLDGKPYRVWLACAADGLTAPPPGQDAPSLDWGVTPRLPPWATSDAVASVRDLIRAAAADVEPLAPQRGLHVELEAMRSTSRMVRHLGEMTARFGLWLAAPYYDDRVIEAGLAVRPEDKITPWRYKPLIVEAMRDKMPPQCLERHSKDEGSHEVAVGLREHRGDLLALCEDSRLHRLGLIDADALRDVCSRPLPQSAGFDALYQTFACEVWLRSLERDPVEQRRKRHDARPA